MPALQIPNYIFIYRKFHLECSWRQSLAFKPPVITGFFCQSNFPQSSRWKSNNGIIRCMLADGTFAYDKFQNNFLIYDTCLSMKRLRSKTKAMCQLCLYKCKLKSRHLIWWQTMCTLHTQNSFWRSINVWSVQVKWPVKLNYELNFINWLFQYLRWGVHSAGAAAMDYSAGFDSPFK